MRLDQARPGTWLLAIVAAWALLGWLFALAGMGGRIEPAEDDPALVQPLVQLQAPPAARLGPLSGYSEAVARPLFAPDRRPHPFVLEARAGDAAASGDAFDYVLNSVMLAPGFGLAILEPSQGGDSVRVRLGGSADAIPGWRLVELQPRSAVFEGPDGRRTLELRTWSGGDAPSQASAASAPGSAPESQVAAPEPPAVAPAPTPVQTQMDAIRKRIEARRAQLRQQAGQPTAPARNP